MTGLMIAAPASGSGKTVVTLGLLRALKRSGIAVSPAKAGPDFIDPAFHAAAAGKLCCNLDSWAMRPGLLGALAEELQGENLLIVEAMMGLFDGAADGSGSAADLAQLLDLSVLLVLDCAKTSHSIAAVVSGFAGFRPGVRIAGVLLNKVGSDRHEHMLRQALLPLGIPVVGVIKTDPALVLPERHLGLVQAGEHIALDAFIERAADAVTAGVDLEALRHLANGAKPALTGAKPLPPLGQRIAVAQDVAFAFAYPHLLRGWQTQGAEIRFFSPLADDAPDDAADAIFLPGGYPELHAGCLAAAEGFRQSLTAAAGRGVPIYGECGGYMVLGEGLVDAQGTRHRMAGLLPLVTSFETRKRHLGYRKLRSLAGDILTGSFRGHEFHYSSAIYEGEADRLFDAHDALDQNLGRCGLRRGSVFGSYMHIIDRVEA